MLVVEAQEKRETKVGISREKTGCICVALQQERKLSVLGPNEYFSSIDEKYISHMRKTKQTLPVLFYQLVANDDNTLP